MITLTKSCPISINRQISAVEAGLPQEVFFPLERLWGTPGYAITPEGARIMIDAAHHQLALEVDAFIRKDKLDILGLYPHALNFTTKFSVIRKRETALKTPEEIWQDHQTPGS